MQSSRYPAHAIESPFVRTAVGPDPTGVSGPADDPRTPPAIALRSRLALRDNAAKPPMHYLFTFPHAIRGLAQVCKHGESKYGKYNYLKGFPITGLVDSLIRHIADLMEGKDLDLVDPVTGQPGSGRPIVDHIVWNALELAEMFYTRMDLDDRPQYPTQHLRVTEPRLATAEEEGE